MLVPSNQTQRRGIPKRLFVFATGFVVMLGILGLLSCSPQAQSLVRSSNAEKPVNVPAKVTIVSEKEPGEPMIISGTIFAPDGRTPAAGIDLFVYQTDATGVYSTSGNGGDNRNTRIHGLVRSGADGRYEFRSIKPGSYPATRNPAHIHAYVSGPGYPEYWIDEYHFADDPFVTDAMRSKAGTGSFSSIVTLKRSDDGILRGVRDIKIERCAANCTGR
jgi:protocatechuate 3,4-dioxygenase beta subunit